MPAVSSAQASTAADGKSKATSRANVGPERTANFGRLSSSSANISLINARECCSIPLLRMSKICSAVISGRIFLAISRVKCEGGAAARIREFRTISSKSVLAPSDSGSRISGKKEVLTCFWRMFFAVSGSRHQS